MYIKLKNKKIYKIILRNILPELYIYKKQNLEHNVKRIYCLYKKNFIVMVLVNPDFNIRIRIIKLKFLKNIYLGKNIIFNKKLYSECIECGRVHAQHKYKNCGCAVNCFCAYNAAINRNKCKNCNKLIIKNKIKFKKCEKKMCSICLTHCNYKLESCGHNFHKKCLNYWYNSNNNCPLCRSKIKNIEFQSKNYINTYYSFAKDCNGLVDIFLSKI